ncbi:hypothetical protein OG866_15540 [Streptomyces sp. NBC_00663]|uniref:hypothetical protein n=1 Tax=Streptomyces sp. NBC_00663 TaxID=2975801 RepID=UPI002E307C6F|nr:hypothetical protein [Streptomyces sp. NBC_00663]
MAGMKILRGAALVALAVAFSASISGCGQNGKGDTAGGAEESAAQEVRREPSGEKLLTAMKNVADAGKGFALKDATGLGRYVYHGQVDGYIACFRKEVPKLQAVDLYAVPKAEKCPDKLGAKVSAPEFPDLTGHRVDTSLVDALMAGYHPDRVKVFKTDDPKTQVTDPKPLAKWRVCTQKPAAGTEFDRSADVRLYVAEACS